MDPQRRQQIIDAVEAWSQEHWNQRWARVLEVSEATHPGSEGVGEYHVNLELSDHPDMMPVIVCVAPDGQMTIEEATQEQS